jgi:aspartate-semialdehyde dehydrogenase
MILALRLLRYLTAWSCESLDKIQVAVIGATGAVGQRFIQLLENHPWFSVEVLAASGRSAGQRYEDAANWRLSEKMPSDIGDKKVLDMDPIAFSDNNIQLIFSALPSDAAMNVETDLASKGFYVFSNASAHRMAQDVPLLIADINPQHLELAVIQKKEQKGFIVTNPNCSVTGLATGLKPLHEAFGIKSVVVTTYQALSGAGYPGVPSMDIAGNVVPYIPDEEEKVEEECQKILGRITDSGIAPSSFTVIASCARVPVRDGHLESVCVDLKSDFTLDEVKQAFSDYEGLNNKTPTSPMRPIIVTEDESRPQPLFDVYKGEPARARGMAVTVGRIKKVQDKVRFYLLVHNTIRGAAGCSIMNAELAKVEGLI